MTNYIIRVNDEEQGPYAISDLEMYERIGEINPLTKVRRDGHDVWRDWGTIKAIHEEEKRRAARYAEMLQPANQKSKHQGLKIFVSFWAVCAIIVAVGGLMLLLSGSIVPGVMSMVGAGITALICVLIFRALDE